MKKFIAIILLCGIDVVVMGQELKTTTLTLDLATFKMNSDIKGKRLALPSRNLLSFKLTNCNPYKYRYIINYKTVDLFKGLVENPFDGLKEKEGKEREINSESPKKEKPIPKDEDNIYRTSKTKMQEINNLADTLLKKIILYKTELINSDIINGDSVRLKREKFRTTYLVLRKDYKDIVENVLLNTKKDNPIFIDIKSKTDSLLTCSKKLIEQLYAVTFSNYLLPIDIHGKNIDAVDITIEQYSLAEPSKNPEVYPYRVWIKGGLKIDISGGVFITSLMDREYFTTDTMQIVNGTEQTYKIIHVKNKGSYDFGFGSTINTTYRSAGWVNPTLSIGALFTVNQKFQILAGAGIILGKEERIVLHGGLTMGTISSLSKGFSADGKTSYDLGTSGQVPLDNKFEFGHFFGITYNLSKIKTNEKSK